MTWPKTDVRLFRDERSHFDAYVRLNERWLKEYFQLEEADDEFRRKPGAIVEGGGHIFTAVEGEAVVGACALFKTDSHEFELVRMAVDPNSQRRGIGRLLADHALDQARQDGATRVFLRTDTALDAAVHLYETLGFQVMPEGPDTKYSRCNLVLRRLYSQAE